MKTNLLINTMAGEKAYRDTGPNIYIDVYPSKSSHIRKSSRSYCCRCCCIFSLALLVTLGLLIFFFYPRKVEIIEDKSSFQFHSYSYDSTAGSYSLNMDVNAFIRSENYFSISIEDLDAYIIYKDDFFGKGKNDGDINVPKQGSTYGKLTIGAF